MWTAAVASSSLVLVLVLLLVPPAEPLENVTIRQKDGRGEPLMLREDKLSSLPGFLIHGLDLSESESVAGKLVFSFGGMLLSQRLATLLNLIQFEENGGRDPVAVGQTLDKFATLSPSLFLELFSTRELKQSLLSEASTLFRSQDKAFADQLPLPMVRPMQPARLHTDRDSFYSYVKATNLVGASQRRHPDLDPGAPESVRGPEVQPGFDLPPPRGPVSGGRQRITQSLHERRTDPWSALLRPQVL